MTTSLLVNHRYLQGSSSGWWRGRECWWLSLEGLWFKSAMPVIFIVGLNS